ECFRSRCSMYKLPLKPACKQASRQLLLSISTTLRVQSTQRHKPKKQIIALEISPQHTIVDGSYLALLERLFSASENLDS
ncbi:MAG: hypothetical protein PUC34_01080, partial [Paludibacteraceae bacterium]|nr:hypothetical protein [Paludibacteraceae bacterium]